jgi:cell division protein ZapA (FtsZ GTPase activity inhibitor)
MEEQLSFKDYVIVSCGTLAPELNYLRKEGFLDPRKTVYTTPGRHEVLKELESQLIQKIDAVKEYSEKIIIVYGGKFCYVNVDNPYRTIDTIIQDQGTGISISRINATHCMDMLADESQRDKISEGKKIWWLTPGWMIYRNHVFQDWDKGKANENFPQHTGGAILLDGIGFWDRYSEEHPEKILEFSDWMGIEIRPHKITLDRLKNLLAGCVVSDLEKEIAELKSRLPAHSAKPSMVQRLEELEEKVEKAKRPGKQA